MTNYLIKACVRILTFLFYIIAIQQQKFRLSKKTRWRSRAEWKRQIEATWHQSFQSNAMFFYNAALKPISSIVGAQYRKSAASWWRTYPFFRYYRTMANPPVKIVLRRAGEYTKEEALARRHQYYQHVDISPRFTTHWESWRAVVKMQSAMSKTELVESVAYKSSPFFCKGGVGVIRVSAARTSNGVLATSKVGGLKLTGINVNTIVSCRSTYIQRSSYHLSSSVFIIPRVPIMWFTFGCQSSS